MNLLDLYIVVLDMQLWRYLHLHNDNDDDEDVEERSPVRKVGSGPAMHDM